MDQTVSGWSPGFDYTTLSFLDIGRQVRVDGTLGETYRPVIVEGALTGWQVASYDGKPKVYAYVAGVTVRIDDSPAIQFWISR